MWSIRDKDAPKIAEEVYREVFKDGKPNRKRAAHALHEGTSQIGSRFSLMGSIHTHWTLMSDEYIYETVSMLFLSLYIINAIFTGFGAD